MGLFDFDNLRKSILSSDDEEKLRELGEIFALFLVFYKELW